MAIRTTDVESCLSANPLYSVEVFATRRTHTA